MDFDALEKKLAKLINSTHIGDRGEARVRLRVMLKLRATDAAGSMSEALTVTETVGARGFLCRYPAPVKQGGMVEVFHARNGQQSVGKAKAVRIDWQGSPGQRVDFSFVGTPTDWVLR